MKRSFIISFLMITCIYHIIQSNFQPPIHAASQSTPYKPHAITTPPYRTRPTNNTSTPTSQTSTATPTTASTSNSISNHTHYTQSTKDIELNRKNPLPSSKAGAQVPANFESHSAIERVVIHESIKQSSQLKASNLKSRSSQTTTSISSTTPLADDQMLQSSIKQKPQSRQQSTRSKQRPQSGKKSSDIRNPSLQDQLTAQEQISLQQPQLIKPQSKKKTKKTSQIQPTDPDIIMLPLPDEEYLKRQAYLEKNKTQNESSSTLPISYFKTVEKNDYAKFKAQVQREKEAKELNEFYEQFRDKSSQELNTILHDPKKPLEQVFIIGIYTGRYDILKAIAKNRTDQFAELKVNMSKLTNQVINHLTGDTALHVIARSTRYQRDELTFETWANINFARRGQRSMNYNNLLKTIRFLKNDLNCDINIRNYKGQTPLHTACEVNEFEVARILLENGALIDATDQYGNKPIHLLKKPQEPYEKTKESLNSYHKKIEQYNKLKNLLEYAQSLKDKKDKKNLKTASEEQNDILNIQQPTLYQRVISFFGFKPKPSFGLQIVPV